MAESKLIKALDLILIPGSMFRTANEMRRWGIITEREIGRVYEDLIPAEIVRVGVYVYLAGNALYSLMK